MGTEIGATPNFNQNVSSGHCVQAILYAPRIEILARALIPQLIGIYLHEEQLGGKFEYLYDDYPIFLGRVYFYQELVHCANHEFSCQKLRLS